MLVYGKCECFVMQMLYVCVLCASCGSSQCWVLHDLQFVNAGRAGQVRLGVGSWPSNQATEGSNPEGSNLKGTRLYFVILLKNVEKIFDWH